MGDFTEFADVATVVMCALTDDSDDVKSPEGVKALEMTSHDFVGCIENTYTLAWGEDSLGLACSPPSSLETSFHFVIGYDALEVKADQDSFQVHEAFQILVERL